MRIAVYAVAILPLVAVLFASCGGERDGIDFASGGSGSPAERAFEAFRADFIDGLWQIDPDWATSVGYYAYDDRLVVPDAESRAAFQDFLDDQLKGLRQIDPEELSAADATDWTLIEGYLIRSDWYQNELRLWEWDPSRYNVASTIGLILNTDYKSLEDRLRVVGRRLELVPEYYSAAMSSISDATLEHVGLAIEQNDGTALLLSGELMSHVEESTLPTDEKEAIARLARAAVDAVAEFGGWLREKQMALRRDGARDFRLGGALYERKFELDIASDLAAEDAYRKALEEKDRVQSEMVRLSHQMWPSYFPGEEPPADSLAVVARMIDRLSDKHVDRKDYVESIRRQIPELESFVRENDLVDLDSEKPLVVREMPAYQRGFAGASIEAPGPYDVTANTYYNVSPLDGMTDVEAESWLREYNDYIMQVLNIHEAIPGHYAQLVYANKSPSVIKSVLGNGAMVEGWAVYAERMMMEEGYGDFSPELWLMFYKWNLRAVVNTILDYSIHVLGMTEEEALTLMMRQAFQEEAEARGKWRRATVSQVQLASYFTGYIDIYDFREDRKRELGDAFDLRAFHDEFLSYGSAPISLVKRLMRGD
jgi:uncharacterized protein (DUF885 family)